MAHKGYEIQDLLEDAEILIKFYTDTETVKSLYVKNQETPRTRTLKAFGVCRTPIEPYWNEYRTQQLNKMLEAWKELNKHFFFENEPTSKEVKNNELQRYAGDIERAKDRIEGFCRKHIGDAECKGVLQTLLKLWGEMDRYHKKLLGDIAEKEQTIEEDLLCWFIEEEKGRTRLQKAQEFISYGRCEPQPQNLIKKLLQLGSTIKKESDLVEEKYYSMILQKYGMKEYRGSLLSNFRKELSKGKS